MNQTLPGLIELSARLSPLETELTAALKGGIRTIGCLPNAQYPLETPAQVEALLKHSAVVPQVKVLPVGALTVGLAGTQLTDLMILKEAGCIAFSNVQSPIRDLRILRQCYQYAATFELLILVYPEDAWLSQHGVAHEGKVSTRLGLPGIPPSAETVAVAQHLALAEETGVRLHFVTLSSARSLDLLAAAQQQGLAVTAGVSIHHLWLTEMDLLAFNAQAHVRPPLRAEEDRAALRQALQTGLLSVITSDHTPLKATAKLAPLGDTIPGISGLDTLLSLVHHLSLSENFPFETLIKALTLNPAKILGLDPENTVQPTIVYDPQAPWIVAPQTLYSGGHNTPFMGWELPGRVSAEHGR